MHSLLEDTSMSRSRSMHSRTMTWLALAVLPFLSAALPSSTAEEDCWCVERLWWVCIDHQGFVVYNACDCVDPGCV